jgi:Arc/MetJ-type ribon-helix-helix transcriptional regulator
MANELSSSAEYYIARVVADGAFPSRAAVLEAAIAALREKSGDVDPDPHDSITFRTVELSLEECAKLQADALAKAAKSGKSSGFSISD